MTRKFAIFYNSICIQSTSVSKRGRKISFSKDFIILCVPPSIMNVQDSNESVSMCFPLLILMLVLMTRKTQST